MWVAIVSLMFWSPKGSSLRFTLGKPKVNASTWGRLRESLILLLILDRDPFTFHPVRE